MLASSDPRQNILEQMRAYAPASWWGQQCRDSMIHFVEKHSTCFERTHDAGHITGSAWVINTKRTHAALIFHPTLNVWIQPGGHCDGNADVQAVARQEAHEELAVPLEAINPLSEGIFHLDCHLIPAAMKHGKMEEMHIHHDIRYIFELDDSIPFSQNEGEAITEKKWIPLEKLTHSTKPEMATIATMARKSLELFG